MIAAKGFFDAVEADRAEWIRRVTDADASVVTMNRLYAETCATQSELAMMLKVCAHRVRHNGDADLGDQAVELLRKHDLIGSPLRADSTREGWLRFQWRHSSRRHDDGLPDSRRAAYDA